VVIRHALRNALVPVVTSAGLLVAGLLGGLVSTETIFAIPGFGRLIVQAIYQRDFVTVQGAILVSALLIQTTLAMAAAILAEAGLSFPGLGVQPPTPSWGQMLNAAQGFISSAPWLAYWPGLAIFISVLGFNLLGDGLRDALDPSLRH
jgi:peptide/nickel transport system permease protein